MSFVEFPEEVKVGVIAVVVWAISWAFAQLVALVPFLSFLNEFKEPLALAISAALIGWLQNAIPDQYGGIAVIGVQLVLAILALLGVGKALGAKGYRLFK